MPSSPLSSPEIRGDESDSWLKTASHEEILDELTSRFLLNLPDEELNSLERICFQLEQAHWYYEDFIRDANPKFPSLPLKKFCEMLFKECPLLERWNDDHEMAYNTFIKYKTKVPVCGAIMLNSAWDKCVLVKGWKSSSGWGFPKGKINQVESPANCAIREVLEETGYNLVGQLNPNHSMEMCIRDQKITLFIVPGVPEDYPFKTKTRKEISKIEWFRLADLPNWKRNKTPAGRFYLISPFIGPLKGFINANKPRTPRKTPKLKKTQPASVWNESVESTAEEGYFRPTPQPFLAENGEPRTRSPMYSKFSSGQTSSVADESMDPHFANLITALVSSASVIDNDHKVLNDTGLSVSEAPKIPREPLGPVAQTILEETSEIHSSHDRSLNPLVSSTSGPDVEVARSIISSSLAPSVHPSQGTPAALLATNTPRHIALLDAVSMEAARLQESYKTAVANGLPINVNDNFKHPTSQVPAIPSQVSHPSQGPSHDFHHLNGSFSTLSTMPHVLNPRLSGPLPQSVPQDPYGLRTGPMYTLQERPMTSLSSHRGSVNSNLQSGSMNQSQLLALMNGSSINPSAASGYISPRIASQPSATFVRPAIGQLPFSTPQLTPTLVATGPYLAAHPRFPAQTLPPANNALLSILNSGRSASRLAQLPSYSTSQS